MNYNVIELKWKTELLINITSVRNNSEMPTHNECYIRKLLFFFFAQETNPFNRSFCLLVITGPATSVQHPKTRIAFSVKSIKIIATGVNTGPIVFTEINFFIIHQRLTSVIGYFLRSPYFYLDYKLLNHRRSARFVRIWQNRAYKSPRINQGDHDSES